MSRQAAEQQASCQRVEMWHAGRAPSAQMSCEAAIAISCLASNARTTSGAAYPSEHDTVVSVPACHDLRFCRVHTNSACDNCSTPTLCCFIPVPAAMRSLPCGSRRKLWRLTVRRLLPYRKVRRKARPGGQSDAHTKQGQRAHVPALTTAAAVLDSAHRDAQHCGVVGLAPTFAATPKSISFQHCTTRCALSD